MGTKGLLKELPDSNMGDKCVGFSTLNVIRGKVQRLVNIDTGTLVFVCVLKHNAAFKTGGYVPPSTCEFPSSTGPVSLSLPLTRRVGVGTSRTLAVERAA